MHTCHTFCLSISYEFEINVVTTLIHYYYYQHLHRQTTLKIRDEFSKKNKFIKNFT